MDPGIDEADDCGTSFVREGQACYFYGSHRSYDDASANCEQRKAWLVDVNAANMKYVTNQAKVYGGGNNFWIGTYMVRSKVIKRKGSSRCPIMYGQKTGSEMFSAISCNPSNRYVCQKYLDGRKRNVIRAPGAAVGTSGNGFDIGGFPGEREIQITSSTSAPPTSTPVDSGSTNAAIPAVISVVVLLLAAIMLRFFCKRRQARKVKKKKMELRLEQEKKTASHVGSTMTANSRTTSVNKPFELPTGGSRAPSSMGRSMISTVKDSRMQSLQRDDKMNSNWDYQTRSGRKRHRDAESRHRHYSNRSLSVERNLHGVHKRTPSPPYDRRHRSYHSRSVSRRRSTSDYSGSIRSSSADSRISDSVVSTITATTFRRSAREPSGHYDRGYSRSTTPSRFRSDRYTSCDEPRRSRTMYDRYAAAAPPMSAHEALSRGREGRGGAYNRGFDSRYDLERQRAAAEERYFPQMSNMLAWSDENLDKTASRYQQQNRPTQPRFPRQAPIRVNRHIHDYAEEGRHQSTESEHIYESLDEMNRRRSKEHDQSRDSTPSRCSGRSRASMRGRKLPAIPKS